MSNKYQDMLEVRADSLAMKYEVKVYNWGNDCAIATFNGDDKQEVLEQAYEFIALQDYDEDEDSPYYTVTIENFEDDTIESCYLATWECRIE